jgi:hypothetical protein
MFPPAEKKRPEPVITTELHNGSTISSSNVERRASKLAGANVSAEASGDRVTKATPPSSMSEETGMALGQGTLY